MEHQRREVPPLDISSEEQTFLDWLLSRYNTTPLTLRALCKQTGNRREYEKMMEWYRRRYRKEMQIKGELIEANPFITQEEN